MKSQTMTKYAPRDLEVREDHDFLFKAVIIGDANVGKTSILHRFTDDTFEPKYKATVGVDFAFRNIKLEDGTVFKIQIWDTAGQERFNSFTRAYYRGASILLLVFDITNEQTFANLDRWLSELRRAYETDCAPIEVVLVGNKCDLERDREVSVADARAFAIQHGIEHYVETSAKTGRNVEKCFQDIAQRYYDVMRAHLETQKDAEPERLPDGVDVYAKATRERRSACCTGK